MCIKKFFWRQTIKEQINSTNIFGHNCFCVWEGGKTPKRNKKTKGQESEALKRNCRKEALRLILSTQIKRCYYKRHVAHFVWGAFYFSSNRYIISFIIALFISKLNFVKSYKRRVLFYICYVFIIYILKFVKYFFLLLC